MNFTFYTSCDDIYFKEHGIALFQSALETNQSLWINIINCSEESREIVHEMYARSSMFKYTCTRHEATNSKEGMLFMDGKELTKDRTFYACHRFISALRVLDQFDKVVIIDIDSYLKKEFPIPEDNIELGLHLRPLKIERGKVLAGVMYLTNTIGCKAFINEVKNKILESNMEWFCDQIAIYRTFEETLYSSHSQENFWSMPLSIVDYEFKEDSYMWTGKGPLKDTNQTYIKGKKELEERYGRYGN